MTRSIYVLFTVYVLSMCMPIFADNQLPQGKGEKPATADCLALVGEGVAEASETPRPRKSKFKRIDTEKRNPVLVEVENHLRNVVKAQPVMIDALMRVLDEIVVPTGARGPGGSLLIDGPTGAGKTLVAEELAIAIGGKLIELEGGNFMHKSKLTSLEGASPTWVGHGETTPVITQKRIEEARGKKIPITIILLNELDKSHQTFQDWWLKGLDDGKNVVWVPKQETRNPKNNGAEEEEIDFSGTLIIATSNAGASQVTEESERIVADVSESDPELFEAAPGVGDLIRNAPPAEGFYDAIRGKINTVFNRPEFLGRWDEITVAWPLLKRGYFAVIEREVRKFRSELETSKIVKKLPLRLSFAARDFIYSQLDFKFGARSVAKTVKRFVRSPVKRAIGSGEIVSGDWVIGDVTDQNTSLEFFTLGAELEEVLAGGDSDEGAEQETVVVEEQREAQPLDLVGVKVPDTVSALTDQEWKDGQAMNHIGKYLGNAKSITFEEALAILTHIPKGVRWGWTNFNGTPYVKELLKDRGFTYWSTNEWEPYDLYLLFKVLEIKKKPRLSQSEKERLRLAAEEVLRKSQGMEDKKEEYVQEHFSLIQKLLK